MTQKNLKFYTKNILACIELRDKEKQEITKNQNEK